MKHTWGTIDEVISNSRSVLLVQAYGYRAELNRVGSVLEITSLGNGTLSPRQETPFNHIELVYYADFLQMVAIEAKRLEKQSQMETGGSIHGL